MNRAIAAALILILLALGYFWMSGSETPVADAVSAGEPVSCQVNADLGEIVGAEASGTKLSAEVEVEAPDIRMEGKVGGTDFLLISDGQTAHLKLPSVGEDWYVYDAETVGADMPGYRDLLARLREGDESVRCWRTGDIDDERFDLPEGASVEQLPAWVSDYDF